MTEFDRQLNIKVHEHKMDSGLSVYEIADKSGIARDTLYKFASGVRSMNAENTKKLMDYLNLTVNLEKR